jgi:hypothetical protein
MLNTIKAIFKPKLSREAFEAYFHRLPNEVKVSWFRDGKFIVGEVEVDDKHKFMTQGLNADDFVEMVNDSVITYFDIPKNYINLIKSAKTYKPSTFEQKQLADLSIKNSSFAFKKNEDVLELA